MIEMQGWMDGWTDIWMNICLDEDRGFSISWMDRGLKGYIE